MKTYYKVLTVSTNFGLISANYSNNETDRLTDGTMIQYIQDVWTYPKIKGSNLFIFKTKEDARSYINRLYCRDNDIKAIYECEALNPSSAGVFDIYYTSSINHLNEMLRLKNKKKKYSHLVMRDNIPPGTVFCKAVKITKEIYRETPKKPVPPNSYFD